MAQGARFYVADRLYVYVNEANAKDDLYRQSSLYDNRYQIPGQAAVYGTPYYDSGTWWHQYKPAVPIYFVRSDGGPSDVIGWVNEDKNAGATAPVLNYSSRGLGQVLKITMTRNHPEVTHNLRYTFGSKKNILMKTNAGSSHEWTIPNSLGSEIPKSTSGTCTVTCQSYVGSRLIGTQSKTFTLTVPDVAAYYPSASHAITETGPVPSSWGLWVQNLSKPKIAVNSAGAHGSSITNIRTTLPVGDFVGSSQTLYDAIPTSGSYAIESTVTDSRGRKTVKKTTLSVAPYTKPSITSFEVHRANSSGTLDPGGTYAKVEVKGSYSSVGGKNSRTMKIYSKHRNVSTWTLKETIYPSESFTVTKNYSGYTAGDSYDFRVEFSDNFSGASSNVVLSTAKVLMDMGKYGLGIGKYYERGALDISGDVFFNGEKQNGRTPVSRQRIEKNSSFEYILAGQGSYIIYTTFSLLSMRSLHFAFGGSPKATTQSQQAQVITFHQGPDINVYIRQQSGHYNTVVIENNNASYYCYATIFRFDAD